MSLKSNNKKNLRTPPKHESFVELFHFIWNHGVGNSLTSTGDPIPWTEYSLESAFETIGKPVDKRTIQNWHSQHNLPNRRNMHALAKIASGGDEYLRKKWADVLINCLVRKPKEALPENNSKHGPDISRSEFYMNRKLGISKHFSFLLPFLIIIGLFGLVTVSRPTPKQEGIRLAILKFENLNSEENSTELNRSDQLSRGMVADLSTALSQSVNLNVSPLRQTEINGGSRSVTEICKMLGVNYFLEGAIQSEGQRSRINTVLHFCDSQKDIWRKSYDTGSASLLDVQTETVSNIVKALGVLLSPDEREKMFSFGTNNPIAYEHYLLGRGLVKNWHTKKESKSDEIWRALEEFELSVQEDPKLSKAWIHMNDIYYHFGNGDILLPSTSMSINLPKSKQDALTHILRVLQKGELSAASSIDQSQARLNHTFFSDSWVGLREDAKNFSRLAVDEKGELEWLFGPAILLFLNEQEAIETLVYDRILKYDPDYGTAYAYAIRRFLVSGELHQSRELLNNIRNNGNSHRFIETSARLDETAGYLYFSLKDQMKLKELIVDENNGLSNEFREYFQILLLHLGGHFEEVEFKLSSPNALKNAPVLYAMALLHTGNLDAAQSELNDLLNQPLGPAILAVQLGYGVGCGFMPLPELPILDQKMKAAGIAPLPCIANTSQSKQ